MNYRLVQDKVVVPWSDQMGVLLGAKKALANGRPYAVVDHCEDATRLLRNMGLTTLPAPILSQYNWSKSTPFDSQKVTAALLTMESRAYILSTMGVGKTRAALFAFDYLRGKGINPALVVAPLSTLTSVWDREVFEVFPHLRVVVLHGSKKKRLELLNTPADIYVINHDGVKVITEELAQREWGAIIVDEASAYSNPGTDRWKAMNRIVNKPNRTGGLTRMWAITGSPTPDAPTDAFGIAKLTTPWTVPRSARRFQMMTMTQLSQFRWVARPDANDVVNAALKPSVRFTLDECHDIPPVTHSWRHVPMTPLQEKLYKTMTNQLVVEMRGQQVAAVNEASKLNKLLQISAGFMYSEDKGIFIDSSPRLLELFDIIKQSEKKVLVFANYKWLVRALAVAVGHKYSVAEITGDTPKKERDETFTSFRFSAHPHVIVAHAGTMAHGLNLIEATTIVWYGPTLSSELYEQANARIRRPGQTCKTHVIHIESSHAEKRAFSRLRHKQKMQGLLLELLEGVHEG